MRRRHFSTAAATTTTAVALGGLPWVAQAQTDAPKEGVDYAKLARAAPVDAPAGKVEVLEFFWYNCPHCASFEPQFDAWAKRQPADVVVRRVPVAFRDANVPQQRLFYALEGMGKLEEFHPKVFNAIHKSKIRLDSGEDIANWVAKEGLDKAKFLEFYNSFGVAGKARRASQLVDAYGIDGVPALGIAGRYYTSGAMARSLERALRVTEFLMARSRQGATA